MTFSKPIPILLFALSALAACLNTPAGEGAEEGFSVQLLCQPASQDESMPQSAVYAIVNQSKVKLASMSACDSIAPASFEDYDIPGAARAAVGGWWAGGGEYLYAIEEDSAVAFYQGWVEEGQEDDSYHYQKIALFKEGRFDLQLPQQKEGQSSPVE